MQGLHKLRAKRDAARNAYADRARARKLARRAPTSTRVATAASNTTATPTDGIAAADASSVGRQPLTVESRTRRRRDYGGMDRISMMRQFRGLSTLGETSGAPDEVHNSAEDPDLTTTEFLVPQSTDDAHSVVATEKSQFASVLWGEMPPAQRVREETVSQSCFCNMIQYSEHLPLSTPLADTADKDARAGAKTGPTTMKSTADAAVNKGGKQCVPTHSTAYLYRAAKWLNGVLRVLAPHTDVVTVARSDDYFLPPTLTADAEWLVLSALHNNGLGVSKSVQPDAAGGKPRLVVKQYVQMEQFLDKTPAPRFMCTRPLPFCVDWTRAEDEICWTSQYQNDIVLNF
jgi:hypothetical protein